MRKYFFQFRLLFAFWVGAATADSWTVNFSAADIHEVIKFIAGATGKTLVIDPRVAGQISIISNRELNDKQLYELFLTALSVHGYAAVEDDGLVRIIRLKEARYEPLPIIGTEAESVWEAAGGEYTASSQATQVFKLTNVSAAQVLPVLRGLVPQDAHIAAYKPSNAIVITGTRANIARIQLLLEEIDSGAVEETEVIQLEYADADELLTILEKFEKTSSTRKSNTAQTNLVLAADGRTNSILISGDELTRTRIRALIRHLDAPLILKQSDSLKVIYLKYADALALAEVLKNVVNNINNTKSGAKGANAGSAAEFPISIDADEDTNSLLINADEASMRAIEAVIQRLDIRRAQVLVEAIIVELEAIDDDDLGVQWLFQNSDGAFGGLSAGDGALGEVFSAFAGEEDSDITSDLASALGGAVGTTLGVGKFGSSLNFAALLTALKATTNANVLSTPSLLTTDNQEAVISVGKNVPFVTGSYSSSTDSSRNPFQTIEREDVGVSLKVTPQINEGNSLVLDITQEVSSLTTDTSASDVITNEREITTQILVEDGEIAVLGGLIEENIEETVRKVPLLGSIPLIGVLFRSTRLDVSKTNLLVFIRARIIRDPEALTGATAEKYRYIREQQIKNRENDYLSIDNEDLPLLPSWEEQREDLQRWRERAESALKAERKSIQKSETQ